MQKKDLKKGQLVQLNPRLVGNKSLTKCIMVITECKEWGAQGYIQTVGTNRDTPGGQVYYRAAWEEMEVVGRAEWVQD